ncbi:hypothetical protein DEAC_c17400 [Desulfosporosinus acididurans]|uniref:Uncharacterized protein n=1 Tax=Desulfosporosinus acididurans TaxID=476652 RepID=A0A0J1INU3_9FIRM|nr:hypothetical protein DEAC_c17400 [Desulfosporosinus acididurans]
MEGIKDIDFTSSVVAAILTVAAVQKQTIRTTTSVTMNVPNQLINESTIETFKTLLPRVREVLIQK